MRINMRLLFVTVMMAVSILCSSTLLAVEPLDDTGLTETLDTLIDGHPTAGRTTVTLKVVDLESGEVLYDRGGDKLLVPASNLKIYTAAAALDMLGPDYRWKHSGHIWGLNAEGVASGWISLDFDWDPMLDTDDLGAHADKLIKMSGLKEVKSVVSVGPSFNPLKGPGWMWDDDPDYYNMSVTKSMLNFNVLEVTVRPAKALGEELLISVNPPADYPKLLRFDTVTISDSVLEQIKETSNLHFVGELEVDREPFEDDIIVTGQLAVDAEPVEIKLTMHNPRKWIESVYTHLLRGRGVVVADNPQDPEEWETYDFEWQSPHTLAEAVKHFLKVSENAVGEMLLLKLAETFGEGGEVSWPSGAEVISDWLLNEAGLEKGSFRLVDGSGLSRYNLISADSSVKLLAYMKTHEHFEPFFDGLPVYEVKLAAPGVGGEKWGGVPLAEFETQRVFAKTGGMSSVSTISGYIKTLDGRWLAFSLLGNGYIGSNKPVKELRNAVWAELVRYRTVGAEAMEPDSP